MVSILSYLYIQICEDEQEFQYVMITKENPNELHILIGGMCFEICMGKIQLDHEK